RRPPCHPTTSGRTTWPRTASSEGTTPTSDAGSARRLGTPVLAAPPTTRVPARSTSSARAAYLRTDSMPRSAEARDSYAWLVAMILPLGPTRLKRNLPVLPLRTTNFALAIVRSPSGRRVRARATTAAPTPRRTVLPGSAPATHRSRGHGVKAVALLRCRVLPHYGDRRLCPQPRRCTLTSSEVRLPRHPGDHASGAPVARVSEDRSERSR